MYKIILLHKFILISTSELQGRIKGEGAWGAVPPPRPVDFPNNLKSDTN